KISFDVCLVDYPLNKICLINEHNRGDFDRELAMVSLAIQEIHALSRAILIARFSSPEPEIFIVRINQPTILSATLHPVPPEWLEVIIHSYRLLDERSQCDKNHF
ncbi:MAG: hypothetical protein KUG73_03300, partial [Pseudomonadales bacterium]|nr:hypothetical protein [Pseudomonadales bacterium]